MRQLSQSKIDEIIKRALREDASRKDITTKTMVPLRTQAWATLIVKQPSVLCGMPVFIRTLKLQEPRLKVKVYFQEGARVPKGARVAEIYGPARGLLAAERVALNFLQRLSGIATLTRAFVDKVKGTGVKILDTRKTTPGLRLLERYAVQIGGGQNHRFDLGRAIMVKDNHKALIPMKNILKKLQGLRGKTPSVLEVENFSEVQLALKAKVPYLQLDNMSLQNLGAVVKLVKGRAKLEATGGVNLKNVGAIAKTNVDFISVGAITHSAPAMDFSLEIQKKPS
jgi:nicotinate-nucleotide pyrophosphorylase (carboxylating)